MNFRHWQKKDTTDKNNIWNTDKKSLTKIRFETWPDKKYKAFETKILFLF